MSAIGRSWCTSPPMEKVTVITTASAKNYPVDLSHFTILGRATGAWGDFSDWLRLGR